MGKLLGLLAVTMALFTVMSMSGVMALDLSATKWSVRGTVGLDDVDNFDGKTLTWANGRLNAHLNLQRGETGSGYVYAQARDSNGDRHRVSINWAHNGNNYGFTSVTDTASKTEIVANARVIYDRNVEYGVPTKVTYNKNTGEFTVRTLDGRFKFSVDNTVNLA